MLLSEIVITAIIFIGVYFIFKNFWQKQEAEKKQQEEEELRKSKEKNTDLLN